MTKSEMFVIAIIWLLTACGCFFGLRAAWRRRRRSTLSNTTNGPKPAKPEPKK